MTSKHIVNDPKTLVLESLRGLVGLNRNLVLNETYKFVSLASIPRDRVAIISGGGSGHEPGHAGMVGDGLLSAAVAGNIFASPNTNQILEAIKQVDNDKGTLIVIMSYGGDTLHFGLAAEQARSKLGKNVRLLAVGDDVAVGREQGKMQGRRGMAGTILAYKVGAALAAKGASLDEVYDISLLVAERTATMGAGLGHTHIPGTEVQESHLAADKIELGMGIHNEPGLMEVPLVSTRELLNQMIGYALDTTDPDRSFVPFKKDGKDEVILMVNNLGGISELEMGGIVGGALDLLKEKEITVRRVLAGTYLTSVNMPGFSISLVLLPREGEAKHTSDELLSLLDAPADAPGWRWHSAAEPGLHSQDGEKVSKTSSGPLNSGKAVAPSDPKTFMSSIQQACKDLIEAEPLITKYDTIAGDGDCGLCLKAGAEGVLRAIDEGKVSNDDVISAVLAISEEIERFMDGTSGALYSIFFNGLASGLRDAAASSSTMTADSTIWAEAVQSAKATLYQYTRARTPSRTLVDPLEAFVNQFISSPTDFPRAVQAAQAAAAETATYEAKAGRAAYVGREQLKNAQVPDPGAHGVAVLLGGLLKAI